MYVFILLSLNKQELIGTRDVGRTLTGGGYTDDVAMTDLSCITYCSNQGFTYAGTEYAEECCKLVNRFVGQI